MISLLNAKPDCLFHGQRVELLLIPLKLKTVQGQIVGEVSSKSESNIQQCCCIQFCLCLVINFYNFYTSIKPARVDKQNYNEYSLEAFEMKKEGKDSSLCNETESCQSSMTSMVDRFLRKPRSYTSSSKNSKTPSNPEPFDTYEKCLSDSIFSERSQPVRRYTLEKSCSIRPTPMSLKLKSFRKELMTPIRQYRILGWKDNYYTSLLDWSAHNFICACNNDEVWLHNMAIQEEFDTLCKREKLKIVGEQITAIKCGPYQAQFAVGYSEGTFCGFDYFVEKKFFTEFQQQLRIAAIEWVEPNLVITGSKDRLLRFYDVRRKGFISISPQLQNSHEHEICGVKQNGNYIASGGNDNAVFIYDFRTQKRLDYYTHRAAVKAMAWIGDKKLITGGGTMDKKIKFWEQEKGITQQIDTGAQVCSLNYSQTTKEIVSCQGFSLNQIILWSTKGERIFTYHGHKSRVLYSAISPSGQYLASGAGDKTLKVWKLFIEKKKTRLEEVSTIR